MPHEPLQRCFGVIPAAGLSRRMGRPKLLLELDGRTVINRLIAALHDGGVDSIHVLVREDDQSLRSALEPVPVEVLLVDRETADMRQSVELLLQRIASRFDPTPHDAWLLCPADHPVLSADVVAALLAAARTSPGSICVPSCRGRRGHPTLFPWPLAAAARALPPQQGLNQLLRAPDVDVREVPVDDETILLDLDTPADFVAVQKRVSAETGRPNCVESSERDQS